jgi:hypothetical protein
VTRTYPLWALFAVVAAASAVLARRRGIAAPRLLSAWVLSSVLLWGCAALLGFVGGKLTYAQRGPSEVNLTGLRGVMIGAPLGALIGAPLGIALSERALRKAWPRRTALALAALGVGGATAMVVLVVSLLPGAERQAGYSILIVFPLLGGAAVLGWLTGSKP